MSLPACWSVSAPDTEDTDQLAPSGAVPWAPSPDTAHTPDIACDCARQGATIAKPTTTRSNDRMGPRLRHYDENGVKRVATMAASARELPLDGRSAAFRASSILGVRVFPFASARGDRRRS